MSSQCPDSYFPKSYKPQAGQMAPKASRQVAFLLRITCKAEQQSQATGNQRAEASSNSKDCRLHSVASSLLQKPSGKEKKVSWLALVCCIVSDWMSPVTISRISRTGVTGQCTEFVLKGAESGCSGAIRTFQHSSCLCLDLRWAETAS